MTLVMLIWHIACDLIHVVSQHVEGLGEVSTL